MVKRKRKKIGYEPLKGTTLTPSKDATWPEKFNRILENDEGWSRNSLTEFLLERALNMSEKENGNIIAIPKEHFTQEEIEILESPTGKQILINLAKAMVGQSTGINMTAITYTQGIDHNTRTEYSDQNIVVEQQVKPTEVKEEQQEPVQQTVEKKSVNTFAKAMARLQVLEK